MVKIEMATVGTTLEYLADTEEQQSKYTEQFGSPQLEQHLQDMGIRPEQLTPDIYANYLEQKNPHYKARMKGGLAEKWELNEYSRETYTSLTAGKFPKDGKQPDNIKKNGNIVTQRENQQTGIDTVMAPPKSVSIEFARGPKEKRDKIHGAMDRASDEFLKVVATQVKPSCQDTQYQDFDPTKTKIIASQFTHYENRGYIEPPFDKQQLTAEIEKQYRRLEPHLHFHTHMQNYAEFTFYKKDEHGNRIQNAKGEYETYTKVLAVSADNVFKKQLENSALFDTLMASELQKEGFVLEPTVEVDTGFQSYRIAGYTDEIEDRFSKRGNEVQKYIAEMKEKGIEFSSDTHAEAEYKKSLRKNTAKSKVLHDTSEILSNVEETVRQNLTGSEQEVIDHIQSNFSQKSHEPDYKKAMDNMGFTTAGVVDETKVRTELIRELRFKRIYNNAEELNAEVDKHIANLSSVARGKDMLIRMENGKYTTLDIAMNEKALVNNVQSLQSMTKSITNQEHQEDRNFLAIWYREKRAENFKLNSGQFNGCKTIINQHPITMIIGDAGTGKTTSTIKFAHDFYSHKGKTVYGVSVGSDQSKALKDANIPQDNCMNSVKFLRKAFIVDRDTNEITDKINMKFLRENLNSAIIFDEAGMEGSRNMRLLTDFAKKANELGGDFKLVLVGDHKQLQSVSYGPAFTNIQKMLKPEEMARLDENARQKNPIAKDIAEGYRDKDVDKVRNALTQSNGLRTGKDSDHVVDRLVRDYLADQNESKLIVCGKNAEIDHVNDMVRDGIRRQELEKKLADPSYQFKIDFDNSHRIEVTRTAGNGKDVKSGRQFAIGEEIIFTQNNTKLGIDNGNRAIIKSIEHSKTKGFNLTVAIGDREIEFNSTDYNRFNHCYAVTTHKSQGKTVDNVYHYGNADLARAQNSYVNGSRHRDNYYLYLEEDKVDQYFKNCKIDSVKETTIDSEICSVSVDKYIQDTIQRQNLTPEPMPEHKIVELNKSEQLEHLKNVTDERFAEVTQQCQLRANEFKQKYPLPQSILKKKEDRTPDEAIETTAYVRFAKDYVNGKSGDKQLFDYQIQVQAEYALDYKQAQEQIELEEKTRISYERQIEFDNKLPNKYENPVTAMDHVRLHMHECHRQHYIDTGLVSTPEQIAKYQKDGEQKFQDKFIEESFERGDHLGRAPIEDQHNRAYVLNAVRFNPNCLKVANDEFKNDPEIVLEACKHNTKFFEHAGGVLQAEYNMTKNKFSSDVVAFLEDGKLTQQIENAVSDLQNGNNNYKKEFRDKLANEIGYTPTNDIERVAHELSNTGNVKDDFKDKLAKEIAEGDRRRMVMKPKPNYEHTHTRK